MSDVTLSKNLLSLGGYAFGDCDSLESIEIPKSIETTTKEYYIQYIYGYQWGVFIACDNLKEIIFEKGTTQIAKGMFANNESIEQISIPDTVTLIGDQAFLNCSAFTKFNNCWTGSIYGVYFNN